MSKRIVIHESVYKVVETIAEERGISKKEAVRDVFKESNYDV